jgi:hypothetical protein
MIRLFRFNSSQSNLYLDDFLYSISSIRLSAIWLVILHLIISFSNGNSLDWHSKKFDQVLKLWFDFD